jgi:hypothetical protein
MSNGKKLINHHYLVKVLQRRAAASQAAGVPRKAVVMKETKTSSSTKIDQFTAQYSRKEVRKILRMKMTEKNQKKMTN